MSSAPAVEPFVPSFDGEVLNDLQERLSRSRRPASEAADGWERGVPGRWLDELLADWQAFDTARSPSCGTG